MEKSDFIRLKHMLEAARTCLGFGVGKDLAQDYRIACKPFR